MIYNKGRLRSIGGKREKNKFKNDDIDIVEYKQGIEFKRRQKLPNEVKKKTRLQLPISWEGWQSNHT